MTIALDPDLEIGGGPTPGGLGGGWRDQGLRGLLRAASRLLAGDGRKSPIEVAHTRLIVVAVMAGAALTAVGARLFEVTLAGVDERRAPRASSAAKTERADIFDRNGQLLATSVTTSSAFADPRKITNPEDAARRIHAVLPDVPEQVLLDRFTGSRTHVYIRRNLTPRQEFEVNRLGIPGVGFEQGDKRVYPHKELVSHVMGFSDIDNHGISGVEKHFDEALRGGAPLTLSIDLRVQHVLRQELQEAIERHLGKGGASMVMDVRTGEIIGMVSLPDFDPNQPGKAPDENRFNRNTLGVYEMGSTFKIFNTAMGLEYGTTSMRGGYDATNPIQIARFTIKDDHAKKRWLSVPEIFMYSSNIGSVRLAMDVGVNGQRAFLDRLNLTRPLKVELPENGSPQIPIPWRPINLMTIAFGHGMSVTPLQMVTAVTSIVNGGVYFQPTLVKRELGDVIQGTRVISPKTSENMRKLLRLVVVNGTGKKADVEGYLVGGKTGTAEKAGRGGYQEKSLLSSFVSAFPVTDPRYVVFAVIDEPKGTKETYGFATAGWTAAPTVGRIISRIGPMLGVSPVDEKDPETIRKLAVDLNGEGPRRAAAASAAAAAAAAASTAQHR